MPGVEGPPGGRRKHRGWRRAGPSRTAVGETTNRPSLPSGVIGAENQQYRDVNWLSIRGAARSRPVRARAPAAGTAPLMGRREDTARGCVVPGGVVATGPRPGPHGR